MPPAVALGDIDDLVRLVSQFTGAGEHLRMGGPDEGGGFVDEIADLARVRRDLDQPEALVAAIGFFDREPAAVRAPAQPREIEINAIDDWV